MLTRRSLLGFLAAAPFIVRASSLMPVRAFAFVAPPLPPAGWLLVNGFDQYGQAVSELIRANGAALTPLRVVTNVVTSIISIDGSFARSA